MKSSARALRHSRLVFQHSRGLTTASESPLSKRPSRIGSVHYQEGDRVIVINKDGKRVRSRLMAPLKPEGTTRTGLHSYEIRHSDIIGKPTSRLYVHAPSTIIKDKSTSFRVRHPSLDEFVALAPRTVTPIYSSYGATITTLLDIHVNPSLPNNDPQNSGSPSFEILEAGTGNGGLTLHLARSIAAANPPPPYFESEKTEEELAQSWEEWRSKRRAVVHTVEFQKSRSWAAEKLIKSFRGALYWPHIDFHSGDVGEWVRTEHERRRQSGTASSGFLDIVILDLPSVHSQIQHVVEGLKEDGQLLVWVPQITQVAACQQQIEHLGLPFKLEQAVELGEGVSNGRRWDMRFVKTRAEQRKELAGSQVDDSEASDASTPAEIETEDPLPSASEDEVARSGVEFPTMVCRPMVGELIMGGGFVGLWRKVINTRGEKDTKAEKEAV